MPKIQEQCIFQIVGAVTAVIRLLRLNQCFLKLHLNLYGIFKMEETGYWPGKVLGKK